MDGTRQGLHRPQPAPLEEPAQAGVLSRAGRHAGGLQHPADGGRDRGRVDGERSLPQGLRRGGVGQHEVRARTELVPVPAGGVLGALHLPVAAVAQGLPQPEGEAQAARQPWSESGVDGGLTGEPVPLQQRGPQFEQVLPRRCGQQPGGGVGVPAAGGAHQTVPSQVAEDPLERGRSPGPRSHELDGDGELVGPFADNTRGAHAQLGQRGAERLAHPGGGRDPEPAHGLEPTPVVLVGFPSVGFGAHRGAHLPGHGVADEAVGEPGDPEVGAVAVQARAACRPGVPHRGHLAGGPANRGLLGGQHVGEATGHPLHEHEGDDLGRAASRNPHLHGDLPGTTARLQRRQRQAGTPFGERRETQVDGRRGSRAPRGRGGEDHRGEEFGEVEVHVDPQQQQRFPCPADEGPAVRGQRVLLQHGAGAQRSREVVGEGRDGTAADVLRISRRVAHRVTSRSRSRRCTYPGMLDAPTS